MTSFRSYTTLSLLSATTLITYTFLTRTQFYPSMVYIGTSKIAYLILANASVALCKITFTTLVRVFLGELREAERDAISDGLRWNLTELCIVMTIFREEMGNSYHFKNTANNGNKNKTSGVMIAFLFLSLVVSKCLHWVVEIRGLHNQHLNDHDDGLTENHDENENTNDHNNSNGWMHRFISFIKNGVCNGNSILAILLLIWDVLFATQCVSHIIANGASLRLMFAFEYAILAVSACTTIYLHVLHVIDVMHQWEYGRSWNRKGVFVLATELWADALKFMFYLAFFAIIFTCYGMPLNLVRDLYISFNNLKKRISVFIKYRELTKNMNDRFRDATQEELEECGHICIICRDTMEGSDTAVGASNKAKVLPCGHVFHFFCLRSWLQQQQSCPTCRQNIPKDARSTPVPSSPADDIDMTDAQQQVQGDERDDDENLHDNEPIVGGIGNDSDNDRDRCLDETICLEFGTPIIYKVINPNGAKVYPYETLTKSERTILRTIPEYKIIVCTARQRSKSAILPDEMMLRIPDGWICDCDIQMIPGVDLTKFSVNSNMEKESSKSNNTRNDLLSMQAEIKNLRNHVCKRISTTGQSAQAGSE